MFFTTCPMETGIKIKSQQSLALKWKSDWGDPAVLRDGQDVMSVLAEYEGAQPSSRGESG